MTPQLPRGTAPATRRHTAGLSVVHTPPKETDPHAPFKPTVADEIADEYRVWCEQDPDRDLPFAKEAA